MIQGVVKINKKIIVTAFILALCGSVPAYSAMSPQASSLYQEACTLEYQKNYQLAIEKVLEAVKFSPNDAMLYTKLAGLYTDTDNLDKAVQMYSKVIELRPNDAFVYISLGSIYETQGKYAEALGAYNNALRIFPEYKYNYLNIANVQYQTKNYKEAINNYNLFLSTYSQHWEARKSLANSYLADKKPDKAVAEFEHIYVNNNSHFDDWANYGLALYETGDYSKAAEFLEKAVEKDLENLSVKVCLALTYQALEKNDLALAQFNAVFKADENLHYLRFDYANLLADMSKTSEAIKQYKKYAEYYPEDYRVYKNLGIVYQRQKDYKNAIKSFEKLIAMDVKDNDVLKSLAACYHYEQDYEKALKLYDEMLALDSNDIDAKTNKAIALHAMGKYSDAIDLYNDILTQKDSGIIQNNLTDALIAQGKIELEKQNYSSATDIFIKAISRGTKDSEAYFGLARAYRACKVNDKATEYYEKAISMNPDKTSYSTEFAEFISEINSVSSSYDNYSGEIQAVVITDDSIKPVQNEVNVNLVKNKELISNGDTYFKAKKYDDSLKNYKEAILLNPSDEETLFKIGYIYQLKDDEKNAVEFYKKAIFVNPEYADAWFNLGLVYANTKQVSDSKNCFNKVTDIDKENAYAYYALAVAYETENNNAEAVKNYELFLKYNKDSSAVSAVQDRIKSLKK